MIGALTNHLWQSTVFGLAAALVAFALRKNGAHVRHRVWLIASLKFLVPFSILVSLGGMLPRPAPAVATSASSAPDVSIAVDRIAQPFTSDAFIPAAATTSTAATMNWSAVIFGVWACGFVVVVWMRLRDWRRIRAALRGSTPMSTIDKDPRRHFSVRMAPGLLEPGVVGFWKPVLLLPAGIDSHLTPAQLEAVLAHELCHVARRDNLTSALHMVVEAIFWFHPFVWWVGARLVDERERACDEHVLRVCGEPQIYAESILNVCKLYVESPLACVSGVTGADLKKRIAAIMLNRVGLQLNVARKLALVAAAALAVALPLVAGMVVAPLRVHAEAQSTQATRKFEVASVKPCDPAAPPAGARSGSAGNQALSGYLNLSCMTLKQFVNIAYNGPDHPLLNRHGGEDYVPDLPKGVRGGPSWAYSETWTIEAKADGATDRNTLTGPLLRALLEDRFQLKTHRATEQQSMYALTVAKSGLKIKPIAPGDCWIPGPAKPAPPKNVPWCGGGALWGSLRVDGIWLGDAARVPEGDGRMVDLLWVTLQRVVIDKTDLNGRYSFAFDFTPDDSTPGSLRGRCGGNPNCEATLAARGISDARPTTFKSSDTIFQALEKLGLHLAEAKAPSEYIVIDSAERPRPNNPAEDALPPARGTGAGPSTGLPSAGLRAGGAGPSTPLGAGK